MHRDTVGPHRTLDPLVAGNRERELRLLHEFGDLPRGDDRNDEAVVPLTEGRGPSRRTRDRGKRVCASLAGPSACTPARTRARRPAAVPALYTAARVAVRRRPARARRP